MKVAKLLAVLLLVAAAFAGGYVVRASRPAAPPQTGRRILYYVDPMHPAYKSDKPGIAPDCGMQLEPVYADEIAAAAAPRTVLYYRDPQDASYRADKAGINPETGNALEPVYDDKPALTPGAIRVTPQRQQMIGVRFATVEADSSNKAVRTVGKVAYDETRIAHVHTRFEGWIEKVMVDFTGDLVKKGQPMFTIYSPEMLASQQELLLAAKARRLMIGNPLPSAAEQGDSLFEAAKRRLQLWDLGDDQIEQVVSTGKPIRSVTVTAPMSGYITERNAFPNQRVMPDSDLYTIVDLSRVWILADVFESDIPSVKSGDVARVTLPWAVGTPLNARVNYIQPQVDPTTRTLKVRLDLMNPGMRLKPDMFVNVDFSFAQPQRLTVPVDAVVDTGDRQTVFVDRGNGYFEPRLVRIGERIGDRVSVLSGLTAGERIVASGTFLIDSESQMKAAAAGAGAPEHQHGGTPAPMPASPAAADHKPHSPEEHRHD